jgi:HEAT repeat protein
MPRTRQIRWLAVVAGLTAVSAIVTWLVWSATPPEPVYQGRPLREWLREFDSPYNSSNHLAAREAVLHMGTNVLPHLERYLRHKDWRYHRQWMNLKARLGMLHPPIDYAFLWHRRAAMAVGQFGEAGAPAFPAMMEAANTRQAEQAVTTSLSWMFPRSVPALTNLLMSTNLTTRYRAIDALSTAPSHPSVEAMARTALLNALHDPDRGMRMTAASALGMSVGISATHRKAVIPALIEALNDPDPSVRGNTANSLGNYGTNALAAVPHLLKLLQDSNNFPRQASSGSLLRIDPAAAKAAGISDDGLLRR